MSDISNSYTVDRFEAEEKTFYIKSDRGENEIVSVHSRINLEGKVNDNIKTVNTTLSTLDYICCRLVNPYLNAQNDVFKINIKVNQNTKSVGYIFPAAALEDDEEDLEDNFDEIKQAYKFYCINSIVSSHEWNEIHENKQFEISELLASESSYLILYRPILGDLTFDVVQLLPSLATYGYFNYPKNSKAGVLQLLSFEQYEHHEALNDVIESHFLYLRNHANITLKSSKNLLAESPLVTILYKRLLGETDNPLYRFLILYQVIEYLVEQKVNEALNVLVQKRNGLSNYKFMTELGLLKDTRRTINTLLGLVTFDKKDEVTGILRSFILEFENDYEKNATGDCLYDIRNLLFHDYKSILEKNRDGGLVGLIIQCELLIHHLVLAVNKQIVAQPIITNEEGHLLGLA